MRLATTLAALWVVGCVEATPTDIILHGDVCATWDSATVADTFRLDITIHDQCLTVEPTG